MDFIKSSVILMLPALPNKIHINISSCIREYQLFFSLMVIALRNDAAVFGPGAVSTSMHSENTPHTAALHCTVSPVALWSLRADQ